MKISKKSTKNVKNIKKMDTHWKNLLELTIRQQQSTKIHKNKKTQAKKQRSTEIRPKISKIPSNLTGNGQKWTKKHENQQTSSKNRPKTHHFHECFQK